VLERLVASTERHHQLSHRLRHMSVEFALLCVHSLHVLLSILYLMTCTVNIFGILGRATSASAFAPFVCIGAYGHALGVCLEEASENFWAIPSTSPTVFDGGNPSNIRMAWLLLLLLEWQVLVKLSHVCNRLKLIGITLHLLLQVFDSFGHALCNFQIMLHLLHRRADLGLLERIFGESLMSILKLPDLFLLQVYFGHLSMVIRQLLVVIVVRWLLVLLQFVNGLLVFLLRLLVASSCCLIITTFLVTLNLYLLFLEWGLIR